MIRHFSNRWQFQEVKASMDELVRRALEEGPQYVSVGNRAVVVLAAEQYETLSARARQPKSLVDFFAASPLAGTDLDLDRSNE
jgi:prevent-host-death family protein